MKKFIPILIVVVFLSTVSLTHASVFDWINNLFSPDIGAPTSIFQRTILPETTETYNLGSTANKWLNVYTNFASTTAVSATTVCLGSDCQTSWPAGGTYTATYPITLTGTAFGTAFGTTTANTFSALNIFGNASTTQLSVSSTLYLGTATTTASNGFNISAGCFAVNGTCVGAGGTGITSLGGQTGATQTFATSSDTNIGITITSTGDVHTFTSNWIGTLANNRLTNSTISGISLGSNLAALSATNGTLTFSGSYTGATARTIGLNLGNANTWTALQTFANATSTQLTATTLYFPNDSVEEADINFITSCATGNHLYVSGTNLACEDSFTGKTTANLTENTNLYYTDTRARAALSSTATGLTYTSGTGVFSLTSGYNIPLTASTTNWNTAYNWGNHASAGYLTTVDISANTNLTGGVGLTLTNDDMFCDTASGSVFGCLSSTDWTTFNSKQATISATWPITLTGAAVGFNGLSTSTVAVTGNIPYFSGVNTFANVATTTLTGTAPIVFSNPVSVIGASASAISCTAASASVAGCLSSANWTTFNNKVDTTVTTLSSLASIGTITTGVWNGTSILPAYGGTGLTAGGLKATFIPYGNGTSAFATSSALSFSGSQLTASYASTTALGVSGTAYLATLRGTIDAGGATSFEIPNAAAPTVGVTGQIGLDTTSGQLKIYNSAVQVYKPERFVVFGYATSTAWTGTTTILLAPAYIGETWTGVKCETNAGTLNVSIYDGTNRMNMFNASTTIGTITLSTNNTFTASESRRVDFGTPVSSPVKVSCKAAYGITAD